MEPNLLKEREERYSNRKKSKQKFDSMINLSAVQDKKNKTITLASKGTDKTVRLLDEGLVTFSDGSPYFYIKKGVLKAFYDELPEDYVGSINLGHMDFSSFPFLIGTWTKKDLTLVDIGDGRQGLDVKLNLDDNSIFVKELRRMNYSVGVSAEFFYDVDYESSETLRVEVLSKVQIKDFGIVGEAGNVNSGGINLKGENKVGFFENLMKKHLEAEAGEEVTETTVEETKVDEEAEETTLEEKLSVIGAMADGEEFVKLMAAAERENASLKEQLAAEKTRADKAETELAATNKVVDEVYGKFTKLGSDFLGKNKKLNAEKKKDFGVEEEKKTLTAEQVEEVKIKTNGWGA